MDLLHENNENVIEIDSEFIKYFHFQNSTLSHKKMSFFHNFSRQKVTNRWNLVSKKWSFFVKVNNICRPIIFADFNAVFQAYIFDNADLAHRCRSYIYWPKFWKWVRILHVFIVLEYTAWKVRLSFKYYIRKHAVFWSFTPEYCMFSDVNLKRKLRFSCSVNPERVYKN